jgi:hypothetical protein
VGLAFACYSDGACWKNCSLNFVACSLGRKNVPATSRKTESQIRALINRLEVIFSGQLTNSLLQAHIMIAAKKLSPDSINRSKGMVEPASVKKIVITALVPIRVAMTCKFTKKHKLTGMRTIRNKTRRYPSPVRVPRPRFETLGRRIAGCKPDRIEWHLKAASTASAVLEAQSGLVMPRMGRRDTC